MTFRLWLWMRLTDNHELVSNWTQKNFDRASKKLPNDIKLNEIRLKWTPIISKLNSVIWFSCNQKRLHGWIRRDEAIIVGRHSESYRSLFEFQIPSFGRSMAHLHNTPIVGVTDLQRIKASPGASYSNGQSEQKRN